MGTITTFTHVSLDGFFAGPNGEIDWFHSIEHSKDFDEYTHSQSSSRNTLLMGHKTYDMMKAYWPTPQALKDDPEMADVMDNSPKVVVSKSLQRVEEGPNWKNIEVVHEVDRDQIAALKEKTDVTILGSGSIVQQLSNLGLIDGYQLAVVPVILGSGRLLFEDVHKTKLKLDSSKSFDNGVIVNTYSTA